jgi:hypothetical protein
MYIYNYIKMNSTKVPIVCDPNSYLLLSFNYFSIFTNPLFVEFIKNTPTKKRSIDNYLDIYNKLKLVLPSEYIIRNRYIQFMGMEPPNREIMYNWFPPTVDEEEPLNFVFTFSQFLNFEIKYLQLNTKYIIYIDTNYQIKLEVDNNINDINVKIYSFVAVHHPLVLAKYANIIQNWWFNILLNPYHPVGIRKIERDYNFYLTGK